jgi:hypothetical protein
MFETNLLTYAWAWVSGALGHDIHQTSRAPDAALCVIGISRFI